MQAKMINAAWGLGEAIVGGRVTPDTVVADKASGKVVERKISQKDVMTIHTLEGTCEASMPKSRRNKAVLRPAQVAELARLGARIEDLYDQPMDIEWALAAGRFAILQARPITALPESPPVRAMTRMPASRHRLSSDTRQSRRSSAVLIRCAENGSRSYSNWLMTFSEDTTWRYYEQDEPRLGWHKVFYYIPFLRDFRVLRYHLRAA